MLKGVKQLKRQKNPAKQEECTKSNDLFNAIKPVWFEKHGKVSSEWLSICKEERNQTTNLLDNISSLGNLEKAFKKVKENQGSSGVDGETIKEFGLWLNQNIENLRTSLLTGSYVPNAVKSVEIDKIGGGKRELGIPTIKDRVIQQAINQILQPQYDSKFSENSYGFRPKRNAHQALKQGCVYVKERKTIVVDLDLANFFNEVNHQRLMWLLGTRIGDKRLLQLIEKILKSGIMRGGLLEQRIKGTPQGSPLSPLLSNIVLDELDQELTRRGLSYVRYADDLQIFTSSLRSAERIKEGITKFIEKRMLLKVNREKSGIKHCYKVNFLGHSLLYGGQLGLSEKSEKRLKAKLKEITKRNRGVKFETLLKELKVVLQGWLQYFKQAKMQKKLEAIDGWLKRRLKCYRLKQCKRVIGIVRLLTKLGVNKRLTWQTALSGKGWWRISKSPAIHMGLSNKWLEDQGYYSLITNYKKLSKLI